MRSLLARIKRIERRSLVQGPMRTIVFDPETTTAEAALLNVGKPGRWLLAPQWSSNEAWETAARIQQRRLLAENSRTPKPKRTEVQQVPISEQAPDVGRILKQYKRR